jgi:CBS domain-containing protein
MDSDYLEEELEQFSNAGAESPALSVESFSAPIARLLSKRALTVQHHETIATAIAKLREAEYGAVCVVRDGRLVGLLTERDLICRVIGVIEDYATRPVSDVMLPSPLCLRQDDPIQYAMHALQVQGYRHVPIVDESERPVSIVSIKDVLRYVVGHFPDFVYNITPEPFRGTASREGA